MPGGGCGGEIARLPGEFDDSRAARGGPAREVDGVFDDRDVGVHDPPRQRGVTPALGGIDQVGAVHAERRAGGEQSVVVGRAGPAIGGVGGDEGRDGFVVDLVHQPGAHGDVVAVGGGAVASGGGRAVGLGTGSEGDDGVGERTAGRPGAVRRGPCGRAGGGGWGAVGGPPSSSDPESRWKRGSASGRLPGPSRTAVSSAATNRSNSDGISVTNAADEACPSSTSTEILRTIR